MFTLWAEETLLEDNLVFDIIFLIYYESLCACSAEKWKKLCSLYKVYDYPQLFDINFYILYLVLYLIDPTSTI